jgi:hypothetical protein
MTIGVAVEVARLVSLEVPLPLLLYPRGRGYKEGNRVSYHMILIKPLSLLAYFTYILIDIIIYVLGNTSGSSRIFWMVGRVITDPSLGLLSLCQMVHRVLILIMIHARVRLVLIGGHARAPIKPSELKRVASKIKVSQCKRPYSP